MTGPRERPSDVRDKGAYEPPIPPGLSQIAMAVKIIGGVGTTIAAVTFIPSGSTFGELVLALVAPTFAFQMVEIFEWKLDRRCASATARERLRRAAAIRVTTMALLVLDVMVVRSAEALVISAACLSTVMYASFWQVSRWLRESCPVDVQLPAACSRSDELRSDEGTPPQGQAVDRNEEFKTLTYERKDGRFGILVLVHQTKIAPVLRLLKNWRLIPGYASLTSALLASLCAAALARGAATDKWVGPHPKSTTEHNAPPSENSSPGGSGSSSSDTTTPSTTSTTTTSTTATTPSGDPPASDHVWNGVCRSTQPYQPHAKEPVIGSFEQLYKVQSRLEPLEEGCMDTIYTHQFHGEFYATMTGVNPESSTLLSYSLVSERYGGVLFLSSISFDIMKLVAKVGPVGGVGSRFPRYFVAGGGEFYLVEARTHLIYMFIRHKATEEWRELVPTEARAFLGCVNEVGWVWPEKPVEGPNDTQIIQLVSDSSSERSEGTITLEPGGEARRGRWHYPTTPAKELSQAELDRAALKA
jgi:hypothetical protein